MVVVVVAPVAVVDYRLFVVGMILLVCVCVLSDCCFVLCLLFCGWLIG